MRKQRIYWITAGSGLLLMVLLWFFSSVPSPDRREPPRPDVEGAVLIPSRETVPLFREVPGRTLSANSVVLSSRVTGFIRSISVEEGNTISRGEVLVALDDREVQARLQSAAAELERADERLRRIQTLFEEGAATKDDLEEVRRSSRVAEAEKSAAEAELAYTRIRSPLKGVVIEKLAEPGDLVVPGRPLLRLEDHRTLRFEAAVGEREAAGLKKGEAVAVRLDRLPDHPFSVPVSEIIPASDPGTHSVLVKTDLPYLPGLQSGLFGRMIYPAGTGERLLLPKSAVIEREGLARIYVADEEGILENRLVTLGKSTEDRIEILTGLHPGERVLKEASSGVEGGRVKEGR
jgi:RND family efflux transporter MFP subunit